MIPIKSERPVIIAIDGPAGAGKTSTAKEVARRLGFQYLDTGAMYRAVAPKALRERCNLDDPLEVERLVEGTGLAVKFEDGVQVTCLGNEDVSEEIRSPEVSRVVSPLSAIPAIRYKMVELQRQIGSAGRFVVEGRDIATVVFPDADLKIFLTADIQERAQRRRKDFEQAGVETEVTEIAAAIQDRDRRDSGRQTSPLQVAEDAFVIDTTRLTFKQQVEVVLSHFNYSIKKPTDNAE